MYVYAIKNVYIIYIYINIIYAALKNEDILPFVTTWMDQDTRNESDGERQMYDLIYMWNLNKL